MKTRGRKRPSTGACPAASRMSVPTPTTMATDSDRRLFVIDAMSNRILSVKLGYHAEEKVKLSDVPDGAKP